VRGFTLIEVMVSLFILAVMAGMAWQGVDMVVRSRDSARARTEATLRLHSVLTQWEMDLREMIATDIAPGFEAQGNAMRLTRQTPQGIQVVSWTVRAGGWYRWASAPATRSEALQEAWLASYQLLGNEDGTLKALSGVKGLQLHKFSTQSMSWTNAQSTGDLEDVTSVVTVGAEGKENIAPGKRSEALPDGVRLLISFVPGSTNEPQTAAGTPPVVGGTGTITRVLRLVHP
jgi:general secretion pathway protein J